MRVVRLKLGSAIRLGVIFAILLITLIFYTTGGKEELAAGKAEVSLKIYFFPMVYH